MTNASNTSSNKYNLDKIATIELFEDRNNDLFNSKTMEITGSL